MNSLAPRFVRIADGVTAQAIERIPTSPLPRRLDLLLGSMLVTRRLPLKVIGARQACTDAEHVFSLWMQGVFSHLELRLARCSFCGVVEVRDVSLDLMPGVSVGRGGPKRRSDVLGWYSGRRSAARTYL